MGSKNHEVVPTVLIVQISGLRNGGVNKILGSLAKRNLVARVQNSKCMFFFFGMWRIAVDTIEDDGYRLTYGGYDYLAMRALSKRDSMYSVGNQIGVGKESGKHLTPPRMPCPSYIHQIYTLWLTTKEKKWFLSYIGEESHRPRHVLSDS